MEIEITILGCGDSYGTPRVANNWGRCDPSEPRNRRTRASICVRSEATTIIVDTSPDFREQVNRAGVDRVDAVMFTHAHGDHVHGIDDLRGFCIPQKSCLDIYADAATAHEIENRFSYMFAPRSGLGPALLNSRVLDESQLGRGMIVGDICVVPFDQDHGTCRTIGLRFGDTAYSTDMLTLPESSVALLKGINTWIVDGGGYTGSNLYVHASINRVLELNRSIGARSVFLTHLPNFMDYETVSRELPGGFKLCFDGLQLSAAI